MLAWLYWNPPRELFTIPILDRPIAIYGACFVVGFVLAFFLMIRIFQEKLLRTSALRPEDIADWPLLAQQLKAALEKPTHPLAPVVSHLDRKMRHDIEELQCKQDLHDAQKKAILAAINACQWSRSKLEELLPKVIVTAKTQGWMLTDKLTWYVILGTLVGARLGHVFFYEWPRYQNHLLDIFKVWEGGLASHGGLIAILFAIVCYHRLVLKSYPSISLIGLMDAMVIPAPLVAAWIRIGNFFNQEILGPTTTVPWAVIFGDPMDGGPILPRHPSQLYEAIAYLILFALMVILWRSKQGLLRPGYLSGMCLTVGFAFRFLIEFIKIPQSLMIDESFLQMGQYLSLPFFALGLVLLFYGPRLERLSLAIHHRASEVTEKI